MKWYHHTDYLLQAMSLFNTLGISMYPIDFIIKITSGVLCTPKVFIYSKTMATKTLPIHLKPFKPL